ncbi:MAG: tRNA pseudouridine(55) synthase TruB [Actinomyces sp.]|nr:MAG: tRNA pseudouridine(55) synthase TruB [Actinomyces sp.]
MARRGGEGPSGVAVVDKEAGWTSHDVVARARRVLGTRRIGHAGTLDPDATGVLVLGVGRATRLLRYLGELPKSYVGEIVLGTATSTLDASGEVVATHDMSAVTDDEVRAAAAALTGDILQVPPMVSALKVGGRRLHELAREGVEVERRPRPVTVYRFDVEPVEGEAGVWRAEVVCSGGTYVRSLAADLGAALGGSAHLRSLRRTAVGHLGLDRARPVDELELGPPALAVAHLAAVNVPDEVALEVRQGRVLDRERLGVTGDGPWAVMDRAGDLLAVYVAHRGRTKPEVVVAPPDVTARGDR